MLTCDCVIVRVVVVVVEGLLVGLVVEGGEAAVTSAAEGRTGVSVPHQLPIIVLVVKDSLTEGQEVLRGSPSLL